MDDLIAEEIETIAFGDDIYKDKSLEELNSLLGEAVENEDYEAAAKIRDEISKR
jgi:protein-arginine kinase activator protein McsA